MKGAGPVTLTQVEMALKNLGGEAPWDKILAEISRIRNRDYSHYLNKHNYENTAFQVVQQHCLGYRKYKGPQRFEKIGNVYRLSRPKSVIATGSQELPKADGVVFQRPGKEDIVSIESQLHISSSDEVVGLDAVLEHEGINSLRADEAEGADPQDKAAYNPEDGDLREVVTRQIRARRGQQQFRDALREQYGNRCVVTKCGIVAILEAAHVNPYRGDNDNHPTNGLLLRTDIHTLFDLNLLGVEPEQLHIELHPDIIEEYGHLADKPLICPIGVRPSRKALEARYKLFCQRRGNAS